MKVRNKVIFIVGVCLLLGYLIEFSIARLDINKYMAPGKLVEVNGSNMHVFGLGSGENTIILIPGLGTAAPYVDFEPIWSRLSDNNRVVVIERFGYGYSDIVKTIRNIETIILEMNEALEKSGEKPPYTLVGHSLGGTISLAYAQAYPHEVANIVMLDAPVPKAYEQWERPFLPIESMIPILKSTGLVRVLTLNDSVMNAIRGQQNKFKEVEKDLWATDRSLLLRNVMNSNVQDELKLFHKNVNFVNSKTYNYEIPTLFITTPTMYELIPGAKGIQEEYMLIAKKSKLIELEGGHYIHQYYPSEISEAIINFIH